MNRTLRVIFGWSLMLAILAALCNFRPAQARLLQSGVVDIATVDDLALVRADPAGAYRLVADLDLSSVTNWTPLGSAAAPFSGTFDGGNHAIRNLVIADTQTDALGFFGTIDWMGTVSHLRIENASVTARDQAGILAGVNYGWLSWVSAQGVIIGRNGVGGLVGENDGQIEDSFAIASVSGANMNGGLVGINAGVLFHTYAASKVGAAQTNNYFAFSGGNYISIPHRPEYTTGSFTLEAWFQWTPPGDDRTSVDFITGKGYENFEIHTGGGSGANGTRFIPVYSGLTTYGINDTRAYQDIPNVLQPGWNYVATVWDLTTQTVMVFLNGIPQDIYEGGVNVGKQPVIPLASPSNPFAGNSLALFIGARNSGGAPGLYFHGKIADVRLWNTARTTAQVATDQYAEPTGSEPNLVGYWKLNDGAGASAHDSSQLHNDGTVVGTPGWTTFTGVRGGLVGNNGGLIEESYYDATVSGLNDATNGTPLSTAQMMSWVSFAGFNFSPGEWHIDEGRTYPTPFSYEPPVSITSVTPAPAVYGQSYTVSYAVAHHYMGTPTGSVTVSDGNGRSCAWALTPGDPSTGSCSLSSNAGTRTLTATYHGTVVFSPSYASTSQVINKANQAPVTVVAPASLTYGVQATLSATGGTVSGDPSYSVGSSTGCRIAGTTLYVIDASGTCSVTATKAGDSNYNAVTSAAASVLLVKANQPGLTVYAPDSLTYGDSAGLGTSGGSGGGSVTYSTGASTGCTVSGLNLLVTNASGTCSVTATKAADNNYNAVTSDAVDVPLNKATQFLLTVRAPASLTYGTTAMLGISGGTGTGAVTYSAGLSTGCSVSGTTLSVTNASGTCAVTATKAADSNYNAIAANPVAVTLNRATPTTTITDDTPDPTVFGEDYTITVTVSSPSGTPTGTVEVGNGSPASCTVTLVAGTGVCDLISTSVGGVTLTAVYSGDDNFGPSGATAAHSGTVGQTQTTITNDDPNPSSPGEDVTFTAAVEPVSPAAGIPEGAVDVLLDNTIVCSGTLSGGEASCSYNGLSAGLHTLTARYNGDANFAGSDSGGFSHSVQGLALDDNQTSTNYTDIGRLSTTGGLAPYTYRLQTSGRVCTPENGAQNDGFVISGDVLQRAPETLSGTYSICVESKDADHGVVQRAYAIVINDPPTLGAASLSNLTVAITGTEVGRLTVTDGRAPFTYGLAASGTVCMAQNSSGNAGFSFADDVLVRRADTVAGTYPICVQVSDAEGDVAQYAYTITVSEGPEALKLSRSTVSTQQTAVGSFSVNKGLAPVTYSLQTSGTVCDSSSAADNGAFAVNGSELERRESTAAGTYAVCAQAEDANGMVAQAPFTITVAPPPGELQLSRQTVTTGQVLVGALSTVSGLPPYSYTLQITGAVCSAGHASANALFAVQNNTLVRLPAATAGSYTVCLQTSDANGEALQAEFPISVVEDDAPPPAGWTVELTANQIVASDPVGTVVGTLVSNRSGTTYELVDVAAFPFAAHLAVQTDGSLVLASALTPETPASFPIRVRATTPDARTQDVDSVISVMRDGHAAGAVVQDDTGNLNQGSSLSLDVLANDQPAGQDAAWSSLQVVRYPRHGRAEVDSSSGVGAIVYTPAPTFYGTDSVSYRACDNLGYCVTGSVEVTVTQLFWTYVLPLVFR